MNRDILHRWANDAQAVARFRAKIRSGEHDACWPWLAAVDHRGYGKFGYRGATLIASRALFFLEHGDIPDRHSVCHRCDNPPCMNGAHLFAGTQSENVLDSVAKGRARRRHGETHPRARLTDAQIAEIRSAPGSCQEVADRFGTYRGYVSELRAGKKRVA